MSLCVRREKTDDTSGEDNDEKEAVVSRGRKTANSQGRRKGRITRSMASEANSEEAVTPQQSAELGEPQGPTKGRGLWLAEVTPCSSGPGQVGVRSQHRPWVPTLGPVGTSRFSLCLRVLSSLKGRCGRGPRRGVQVEV